MKTQNGIHLLDITFHGKLDHERAIVKDTETESTIHWTKESINTAVKMPCQCKECTCCQIKHAYYAYKADTLANKNYMKGIAS